MKDKKHKLILEGNAFYEIDLTCLQQKRKGIKRVQKTDPRKKGRGINLCPGLWRNQQPQPLFHPLPHPPQRSKRIRMIQQQSPPLPLLPHPLLLLPQKHIRMMIQRIQLQEFPLNIPFPIEMPQPHPLLPHPHPLSQPQPHLSSPQPQFAAAKSLILYSSEICFTLYPM